jgi:hypothetical protein
MTSLKRETQAAYLLDLLRASPRPLGATSYLNVLVRRGLFRRPLSIVPSNGC